MVSDKRKREWKRKKNEVKRRWESIIEQSDRRVQQTNGWDGKKARLRMGRKGSSNTKCNG
jgi:hypothetical protein